MAGADDEIERIASPDENWQRLRRTVKRPSFGLVSVNMTVTPRTKSALQSERIHIAVMNAWLSAARHVSEGKSAK